MQAIVSVDEAWAIGKGGDQLCYIRADLKRFKGLTLGRPVILGRKTLATFPGGRPLKGRPNLVLTRDPAFTLPGRYRSKDPNRVYHSLAALLRYAPADSFVIGGESVYRSLLPYCDTVYVTKVLRTFAGADAFFPDLDASLEWYAAEESPVQEEGEVRFRYVTYRRTE